MKRFRSRRAAGKATSNSTAETPAVRPTNSTRYGLVNDLPDHLPDDHVGIVLPFAAELLRRGETKALRNFVLYGVGSWWPKAEAALRDRPEWPTLAPVLETFGRFLASEVETVKTQES